MKNSPASLRKEDNTIVVSFRVTTRFSFQFLVRHLLIYSEQLLLVVHRTSMEDGKLVAVIGDEVYSYIMACLFVNISLIGYRDWIRLGWCRSQNFRRTELPCCQERYHLYCINVVL